MNLRQEIKIKEEKIIELEEINNVLLNESNITSFCDGKYTDEIRETIMTLTTECGVSCKKVNQVNQTVLSILQAKHCQDFQVLVLGLGCLLKLNVLPSVRL